MLGTLIDSVTCEICGGGLSFEQSATFEAFKESSELTSTNIIETVDSIVDKYLVFVCYNCDIKYRYTYKDIYRIIRTDVFKRLLLLLSQGQFITNNTNRDYVLIYCGKCTGYDGQGSCPRTVFNNCDIKRFPPR